MTGRRAMAPRCTARAAGRAWQTPRPRATQWQWPTALLMSILVQCTGDRSAHSPTCGLAQVVAPTLVQQRLLNPASVLTEPPRGLSAVLPARVVGQPDQGEVLIARGDSAPALVMGYQGNGFPLPPGGYGLLVVDDSTERAQGVLLYESDVPRGDPVLGSVTGVDRSIPLFGVRVSWASVSNPRCPLLGPAAAPAR